MSLGTNIKKLREGLSITQHELAHQIQLTPKAISFYELDQRMPSCKALCRLAKALKTTPNHLIGWDDTDH